MIHFHEKSPPPSVPRRGSLKRISLFNRGAWLQDQAVSCGDVPGDRRSAPENRKDRALCAKPPRELGVQGVFRGGFTTRNWPVMRLRPRTTFMPMYDRASGPHRLAFFAKPADERPTGGVETVFETRWRKKLITASGRNRETRVCGRTGFKVRFSAFLPGETRDVPGLGRPGPPPTCRRFANRLAPNRASGRNWTGQSTTNRPREMGPGNFGRAPVTGEFTSRPE